MKTFAHILLDLDGTLINSPDIFREVDRRLLHDVGVTLTTEDFAQIQLQEGFDVLRDILDERTTLSSDAKKKLIEQVKQESTISVGESVDWYPDVKEFVEASKKLELTLGIVTRSNTHDIAMIERRIPLRSMIPIVVHGGETHDRHKPDPYPLLLAMERLGVGPDCCLYVGDHAHDIQAAKAAGVRSCIILRRHVPAIFKEAADFSINALTELHTIASM